MTHPPERERAGLVRCRGRRTVVRLERERDDWIARV